jgi:hypothetical protein
VNYLPQVGLESRSSCFLPPEYLGLQATLAPSNFSLLEGKTHWSWPDGEDGPVR